MTRQILILACCILAWTQQVKADATDSSLQTKELNDAVLNTPLLDISAAPSSIVGGAVNVITGNYVESECDLVLPGAQALTLTRSFNSSSSSRGTLCHGWDLNLPSKIEINFDVEKGKEEFRVLGWQERLHNPPTQEAQNEPVALIHDRGANLCFTPYEKKKSFRISLEQLNQGVTNCSGGALNSRTNIKNRKLRIDHKHRKTCELHAETGETLYYHRIGKGHFGDRYVASKNELPNNCAITYEYDHKDRLFAIASRGKAGNELQRITWHYPDHFELTPELTIKSSNGRKALYRYQEQKSRDRKKQRYCLTEVIRDHAPKTTYKYRYANGKTMERMVKKTLPDNRYLKVQYYEEGSNTIGDKEVYISDRKDTRIGRVAALYAPVGTDATPIRTWAFTYHLTSHVDKGKPYRGNIEVFDALGHKKIYRFSKKQRLTAVEHFLDSGKLYRSEYLDWANSGEKKTFLLSSGMEDSKGALLLRKDYLYDDYGNVLKETVWGNLTGLTSGNATWNAPSSLDKHTKTFTYTDKGLLESEYDGITTTFYSYLAGTNLIEQKWISDARGICERVHYSYDANGVLVQEEVDDGEAIDIEDLSGVTERRIKKITPTKTKPIGLPKIIEEWCLNVATGQEELISYVKNSYSEEGNLICQKTYDNDRSYCYCKKWSYDARGNVIEEIDPLGYATTCQYDLNNNLIVLQTPDVRFHTVYTYDCANRLVREERVYNSGKKSSLVLNTRSYDYMGNCIASQDKHGNITQYAYDDFGRLIEATHPPVPNRKGTLLSAKEKVSYDCLNNPISKTNGNGHRITMKNTILGKPFEVTHPDGSFEKNVYSTHGKLIKSIDVAGVETLYYYDYKGRKTKEVKVSPQGENLATQRWIYNAFHLIEEIDPAGTKTNYFYDAAGRQIKVFKGTTEVQYLYDSLGRQAEAREMVGPDKYRSTVSQYDHLNRVIQETVKDESGKVFGKKSYRFDAVGNRTHEIIHDEQGEICTETVYDENKRPTKVIAPDGSETNYFYNDQYQNQYGQSVAFEKVTDANGNSVSKQMDTRGRLLLEVKRDAFGKIQHKTTYWRDREGNLTARIDAVHIEGERQHTSETRFVYDSKNREIAISEAYGDPAQKTTQKEYHPTGELAKIIKPDGIILTYEYDLLHRLIAQSSSDGTIYDTYLYDNNNNILEVIDHVHNFKTTRSYDKDNRLISEVLGTGLQFQYGYDRRSRLRTLTLPDRSKVDYIYDSANLKSLQRIVNGHVYSCHYKYLLSGKISEIKLSNYGNIECRYDRSLRTIGIESRCASQVIPEGGFDRCGNVLTVHSRDALGECTSSYTYDALYHLTSETGHGEHNYRFDSLHNRISKDAILHQVNALNQLTQQGECVYDHDPNGNRSKICSPHTEAEYFYDALDRLIAVITDTQRTEYVYDAFHRRLQKKVFLKKKGKWSHEQTLTFLFQGDKEIGALDKEGNLIELRTLGLGLQGDIGAAVLLELDQQVFVPLHDFRGNIIALVDTKSENLTECYRYTAFGEELLYNCAGESISKALSPWRFSSKRVDPETGWIFFGRRYYDSEVGKWTTPDPLGFKEGPNLYCFVFNRPLKYIDPDGRWSFDYEAWANKSCERQNRTENQLRNLRLGQSNQPAVPYQPQYSQVFEVGTYDDDGRGMAFENGAGNTLKDALASAKVMSDAADGHKVYLIYNPTFGPRDFVECLMGLCGMPTNPVDVTKDQWTKMATRYDYILHGCHSQGAIHTLNAGYQTDAAVREKIHVMAVAPAAYMPNGLFASAHHFVSTGDIVPQVGNFITSRSPASSAILDLDAASIYSPEDFAPITHLTPHSDADWFDHSFNSPTFTKPMRDYIEDFKVKHRVMK